MATEKREIRIEKTNPKLKKAPDGVSSSYEESGRHINRLKDKEYFLRKAFEEDEWEGCSLVFRHYYNAMCSHAVRFVYSKMYAEDIVSEVFTEFWQKKHFRNIQTTFQTYLFRAVRNRSLNFIRKEFGRPIQSIPEDLLLSNSIQADEQLMYEHFYQKVQDGIESLPPKCKKVFLMSRYEGKSLREIAQLQNISVRTAETHISKALKMMRDVLDFTDEK